MKQKTVTLLLSCLLILPFSVIPKESWALSVTVNLTKAGNGAGSVVSNPSGIACDSGCSAANNTFLDLEGSVILTATEDPGSNFTSWAGCDSTIGNQCTVSGCLFLCTKDLTATFALKTFTLSVNGAGNGFGTITGSLSGASISATWDGSALTGENTATVDYGSGPYTVTADALTGSTAEWTGCDSTSGNGTTSAVCTLNSPITDNRNITATFTLNSYTITASAGVNGSISPSGEVSVSYGGSRYFSIIPNANYLVAEVLVDGVPVGTVPSYTFTNVTANHTISASFTPNPHTVWKSHGPEGGYIYAAAVSPNRTAIFAGTYNNGIFKSTDGGQSWTQMNEGLANPYILSIAFSPGYDKPGSPDATVFAGTDGGGVCRSTDGGQTWTQINNGLISTYVLSLAVSPGYSADRTVFAGTDGGGVHKSMDGGLSWLPVNSGITNLYIFSVKISPHYSQDSTVFAATYGGGVYKSTDGGQTWHQINSGLSDESVVSLSVSPDNSALFAGAYGGGIFKSTDGGQSWTQVNSGLTNKYIFTIDVSPNYAIDATVFVGTNGDGVFRSVDGGQSWTHVGNGLTNTHVFSVTVSSDYMNDATVFAGTFGGGIFKSTDSGQNWTQINSALINTYVMSVVVSPDYATDANVFAGTWNGVFKSTNGGQNWVPSGPADVNIFSVAASPDYATDATVFVGTEGGGIYRSINGGQDWVQVGNGLTAKDVVSVALSPNYGTDETVLAGTNGDGIFKSTDGGQNWTQVNNGLANTFILSIAVSRNSTIFAGTEGDGVFRSTDGGQSWTQINKNLTNTYVAAVALSPDYVNDRTVFAGTEDGVFKSTNRGKNWTRINSGLENTHVFSVVFSPNYSTAAIVFAGTQGGVFKSTDGGQSWRRVNSGLENVYVLSLAISPNYSTDGTIFAGTNGGGVFNDPLISPPIFRQWDVNISEKVTAGVKGYKSRNSANNYSEKWSLYANGSFEIGDDLFGSWKRKGRSVIMSLDPEYTGADVRHVLESMSHDRVEATVVSKVSFRITENRNGMFRGRYTENARFRENGADGKITIERNFNGKNSETDNERISRRLAAGLVSEYKKNSLREEPCGLCLRVLH